MSDADEIVFVLSGMIHTTSSPIALKSTALALRIARQYGPEVEARVLAAILHARREWLKWKTLTQRKWQTNVSRRPQRGNHHDSWEIRERYVRCKA